MKEKEISHLSKLSQFDWKTLLHGAINSGTSFALWRKPHQSVKYLLLGSGFYLHKSIPELDNLKNGFVFFPFEIKEDQQGIFIESAAILKRDEKQSSEELNPLCKNSTCLDMLLESCNSLDKKDLNDGNQIKEPLEESILPDKEHFQKIISDAVTLISEHKAQKIVLARNKDITINEKFDYEKLFNALCESYVNAFVSVVYTPVSGLWIGATPEVLIEQRENTFSTTSLAGTQKFDPEISLAKATWSQKEIEEQALVSRYIINCFKKIRLREFEEIGPRTVKAGNLMHLKTDYRVDLNEVNFPELASVMLKLLHPTSAICGMPLEFAKDYILQNEGFDRRYFSGFLGPVNVEDETSIYVNLRCMQLLRKKAILFAGAGITEDSDPESEFAETELKMNTLLNVIRTLN